MDTDTMQKPGSHEETLSRFRNGEIDILLGTQMIAKGLDFPNVTLVGVINSDTALHLPDFRARKTFGLVTQVAGRTGRGDLGGRVLVQTFCPEHPAIVAATHHDYVEFVDYELPLREAFGYPPFRSMARLIARGPNPTETRSTSIRSPKKIKGKPKRMVNKLNCWDQPKHPSENSKANSVSIASSLVRPNMRLQPVLEAATKNLVVPENVQWIIDVDPVDMI